MQAIEHDPNDATLFSNRSLCLLRMGDGQRALLDALDCRGMRPDWPKAYYRQGAALMSLKVGSKILLATSFDQCIFFLNNSFTRPPFITRTTRTRVWRFLMDSSWTWRMPRWNLHYGIHLALLLSHACLCSAYVTVSYILETLYYLTALMCLLKTLNFTNAGVEHWLWVWCAGKLWNLWRYRKAAPRQHDMSLSFALVLKIDACSHLSWKKDILCSSPFFFNQRFFRALVWSRALGMFK